MVNFSQSNLEATFVRIFRNKKLRDNKVNPLLLTKGTSIKIFSTMPLTGITPLQMPMSKN